MSTAVLSPPGTPSRRSRKPRTVTSSPRRTPQPAPASGSGPLIVIYVLLGLGALFFSAVFYSITIGPTVTQLP